VQVHERNVPAELTRGDYDNNPAARERAMAWINALWAEKDARMADMLAIKPLASTA
jgi:hypothetical protein